MVCEVDCTALGKCVLVSLFSMCMLGHYWSFKVACDKGGVDGPQYAWSIAGQQCTHDVDIKVDAYLAAWGGIFISSFGGFLVIMCGAKIYNKIYAGLLLVFLIWLTVMDYLLIGKTNDYYTDLADAASTDDLKAVNNNMAAAWGFRIASMWFAEVYLITNSAYDAWSTEDVTNKASSTN